MSIGRSVPSHAAALGFAPFLFSLGVGCGVFKRSQDRCVAGYAPTPLMPCSLGRLTAACGRSMGQVSQQRELVANLVLARGEARSGDVFAQGRPHSLGLCLALPDVCVRRMGWQGVGRLSISGPRVRGCALWGRSGEGGPPPQLSKANSELPVPRRPGNMPCDHTRPAIAPQAFFSLSPIPPRSA